MTWIPGKNPMDTIGPAKKLRDAGLYPTPHIGARHVESAAQLEDVAGRLVREAGVDRVLIIAGDRDQPAGPFDSSLAVMQSGILQKAGITRISVGGFPEGNPKIPDPLLWEAIAAKTKFARENGLNLTIVTQFAFDVRTGGGVDSQSSRRRASTIPSARIRRSREPDRAHALRHGLRRGRFHEGAHRKAAVRQASDRQGPGAANPRGRRTIAARQRDRDCRWASKACTSSSSADSIRPWTGSTLSEHRNSSGFAAHLLLSRRYAER